MTIRRRRFYAAPVLLTGTGTLPRADIMVDATRSQALTFSARPTTPVSIEVTLPCEFDGDVEQFARDVRARVDGPVSSVVVRRVAAR